MSDRIDPEEVELPCGQAIVGEQAALDHQLDCFDCIEAES
jgi:hypothetical protein